MDNYAEKILELEKNKKEMYYDAKTKELIFYHNTARRWTYFINDESTNILVKKYLEYYKQAAELEKLQYGPIFFDNLNDYIKNTKGNSFPKEYNIVIYKAYEYFLTTSNAKKNIQDLIYRLEDINFVMTQKIRKADIDRIANTIETDKMFNISANASPPYPAKPEACNVREIRYAKNTNQLFFLDKKTQKWIVLINNDSVDSNTQAINYFGEPSRCDLTNKENRFKFINNFNYYISKTNSSIPTRYNSLTSDFYDNCCKNNNLEIIQSLFNNLEKMNKLEEEKSFSALQQNETKVSSTSSQPIKDALAITTPLMLEQERMINEMAQGTMTAKTLDDKEMTMMDKVVDTVKKDMSDGAWMTVAEQSLKVVREPLLRYLNAKLGRATKATVVKMLDTDIGEAGFAVALGASLRGLGYSTPRIGNNKKLMRLADELSKLGWHRATMMLTNIITDPAIMLLSSMVEDLPNDNMDTSGDSK